jgi:Ca2+-binding RTX toxin-like protein
VGLLFNEVYESVTLVTYDLPELKVEGGFSLSIPILPPIALKFTGNAGASIDLKIGYDTKAFEEAVAGAPFAFEDGFFFDATKPLASLTAELTAGAGFDALVLSAWATGGIHFAISASLDNKDGDNKVRLGELGGCFVDPITGKAWADVTVDVEIDFGLFSVSESIPIASVTLAEFDLFKCPPPRMPTSPPNQGLATVGEFGVPPELVLNVGDRASERVVTEDGESKQIPGENEFYFIGLAREPATNEGPFPSTQLPGAIIPDAIDVSAFGYTQRYGSAAAPVTSIRANFGSQNDSLVIAEEITHESHISGGEGNDFMSGGSGRDFFSGDNGEDYLVGKKGDDVLEGGARNDTLDGGQGADVLRGGTGRDKVTYANANKTTGDGVTIFWDESAGKLTAKGGEANGDTFDSIEYLVGTSFNDTLVGNPFLFLTELGLYNTLEGGDGSDLLIGAEVTGDFLIGGRGGDTIDGKSGIDGTTYVTSVGGVYIDLGARVFLLGDAEGDNLISIENVQGSSSNDTIYGDGANNEIDGFVGDDWLSGGGGTDKVSGHLGNDTIFGFGDGDTLDGGGSANAPGVDLLTYRVYTGGPVTVNLRTGQATRAGGSDTIAMAKWDVNPPVLANGTSTFENLEGTNLPGTGDTLVGGAGADALNGGSGVDLADYRGSPGGVRVDLLAGTGTDSDADGDRLPGIENLRGCDHTDRLIGNDSVNVIDPGLSDINARDDVDGKGGTDTLFLDYSRGQSGKGLIGGIGFAKASSVSTGSTDTGVFYREFRTTTNELDGVSFTGIERLHVIGTSKADEIYGGQDDDIINTGKGNDVIVSGLGSDYVDAGAGNDSVSYGTGANWQLTHRGGAKEFKLFGGRGIDTLSVSLAQATSNIVLTGSAPGVENPDVNGTLANGSAIAEFEILRDIWTGDGDDTIIQSGSYGNNFRTGWGVDVITPGLGHDIVDGGFDFRFGVEVFQGESDGLPPISIVDREAFDRNPGDLLMLDYSSLAGTGVSGTANQVVSTLHIDAGETTVFTNEGTYEPTTPVPAFGGLTFTEIERINVKGTNQDDLLVGTDISGDDIVASLRGDDRLEGLDGDDVLVGYFGDDTLLGGAGHDILIGTYAS